MTDSHAIDAVDQCNCTALRKASRRVSQMYDEALIPSGLKSTQFSILSEIERLGEQPPTMSELAAATVMDRSTLGHNLRSLERDGLVALAVSEADSRWNRVILTERGRTKYGRAYSLWREAQDRFEKGLGKSSAAVLRHVLLGIAADAPLTHSAPAVSTEAQ